MAEVLRNDHERHTVHDGMACPGVSQAVEVDRRRQLGVFVRLLHSISLMVVLPDGSVCLQEYRLRRVPAGGELEEVINAILTENDMPRLVIFRVRYREDAGIRVEVGHQETVQLAISSPALQRATSELAKILGFDPAQEAWNLIGRKVSNPGSVDVLEAFDAAPGLVARDVPVTPSPIESGFQDRKVSISSAFAATILQFCISAVCLEPLRVSRLGPHPGWRSRDPVEPFPDLLSRQVFKLDMPQFRLDDRVDRGPGLLGGFAVRPKEIKIAVESIGDRFRATRQAGRPMSTLDHLLAGFILCLPEGQDHKLIR